MWNYLAAVCIEMAATATMTSSGPRYAPEDPTLPKPWRGLVDGKTGYLYFWNPETNVTQYERPTGTSSSAHISSSVQVRQPSPGQQRGYNPDKEDDRYGRGNNGGSRGIQSAVGGTVSSQNGPKGTVGFGHAAPSVKEQGHLSTGSSLSPDAYRRHHEITVSGADVPPPLISFEATGFPSEILREVHSAGFSSPTPIQAQSWPIALQSRDIVAIAKTGSGKTLGYLIPGFIHIKRCRNNSRMGPTVLVLSPTRELATQIQDEAVKFGKSSRISCVCLYGGAPKGPQLRDIDRGADIVVATPGRLNDILEMKRVSLSQVSYLVLDEADRMLDMGFEPQIRKIVREVPARRQTLMYTATWPKEVRKIAADLLVNPVQVNIGNVDELVANKSITQHVEVLAPMEKHRRLEQILRSQEPGSKIIIFCSTKKMCDQLSRNLNRQFGAAAIHGDKSQNIKDIRVVINYDFPTGVEDYVHRIGRTGRAGASGLAYTFFGDQDSKYAAELIKVLEGANQRVPPEIRSMASRGGGGMGRFRRWGSDSGGRDGGRGGRGDSGYGGRDVGRGGWSFSASASSRPDKGGGRGYGSESRDRFGSGHDGYDRARSRSPKGSGGWVDRASNWSRDRSHSPDRSEHDRARSPVRSFHQAMMDRSQSHRPGASSFHSEKTRESSRSPRRARSPSPRGKDNERGNFGGSHGDAPSKWDGGYGGGSRSSYLGEEEEGMIPV
ncbi:hypothetical protein NL676_015031 [Syzygium grande]|nr:hypothetical protein NL676_015031 [Syzygium grande]